MGSRQHGDISQKSQELLCGAAMEAANVYKSGTVDELQCRKNENRFVINMEVGARLEGFARLPTGLRNKCMRMEKKTPQTPSFWQGM